MYSACSLLPQNLNLEANIEMYFKLFFIIIIINNFLDLSVGLLHGENALY